MKIQAKYKPVQCTELRPLSVKCFSLKIKKLHLSPRITQGVMRITYDSTAVEAKTADPSSPELYSVKFSLHL